MPVEHNAVSKPALSPVGHSQKFIEDVAQLEALLISIAVELGATKSSTGLEAQYMYAVQNLHRNHGERIPLLPKFIRSQLSIDSVLTAAHRSDPAVTEQIVEALFSPFWEAVPDTYKQDIDRLDFPPVKNSSDWTGNKTTSEQAVLVRNLVPIANAALEQLIELEVARAHNRPDNIEIQEAVFALRNLHSELGHLLKISDDGIPISGQVKEIVQKAQKIFRFSGDVGSMFVHNLEIGAASLVPATCTLWVLEQLTIQATDIIPLATITAGFIASSGAAKGKRNE